MKDKKVIFSEVYELHSDSIYRHCLFRIFTEEKAEELTQEAFLRFWRYLDEGKEITNPKGLLYRIADHLLIDEKRKKREESLESMTEVSGLDWASTAHLDMETRVRYAEVLADMKGLREEEQRLFTLRYIDDLEPREIAELLGTSPNTVSVQLNRIQSKLRKKAEEKINSHVER